MLNKTREVLNSIFRPKAQGGRATNLAQLKDAFLTGRDIVEGTTVTHPFTMHSTTYACMTIISQAMASVPYKLWLKKPDNSGRPVQVKEHPLLELFSNPYPGIYADFTQFVETWALYLEGGGNVWIWPDLPNSRGLPRSLLVLGVQHVTPEYETNSGKFLYWNIKIGKTSLRVGSNDLIHMKYTNPEACNQVMGVGPLTAAMGSIRGDMNRGRYDDKFFINGSSPSLKLTYTPPDTRPNDIFLTDEQLRQVRTTIEEQWSGPSNAHKVAIVQGGMKLEELGVTHKEMDFIEGRKWSRQEIASVFRIPVPLLNDFQYAGLGREGVQVAQRLLYENNIVPKLNRFTSVLQRTMVDTYAPNLIGGFDIDEITAMREDYGEKVVIAKTFFDMGFPLNQINEVLDLGFKNVVWGDDWLVPNNMVPARSLAGEEANMALTMGLGNILDPALLDPKEEPAAELPAPKPSASGTVEAIPPEKAAKSLALIQKRSMRRVNLSRNFENIAIPLEEAFYRRMHRFFYDLRKEMLQNIKTEPSRGVRSIVDDLIDGIMFDVPKAQRTIAEFSRRYYERAIKAGISVAAHTIGRPQELGIESTAVQDLLDGRIIQVRNIPISLEKRVNELLKQSLGSSNVEGMNIQQIAVALRESTQEVMTISAARARAISRTEMVSVLNEASTLEYAEQGVEKISWLSSGDDLVRDGHDIDEEEVDLGERFSNGLRWPGDVLGSADQVVNCRCTTIAVLSGEPDFN